MMNLSNIEDKPVVFSLHRIYYDNNLLFSKCDNHNTIIRPNHIKNFHEIKNPLTWFISHHILHEKNLKK